MCPSVLRLCDCIAFCYYHCRFKYTYNIMLSLEDRIFVTELLSGMSLEDVLSLSTTVTKGLLKPNPSSREEANEAILQHSESVESILNRKKVSRDLIFNYLHWKKVTVTDNNLDKKSLVTLLIRFWNEQNSNQNKDSLQPDVTNVNQSQLALQESRNSVSNLLEPGQEDLFAQKFTDWFYQMLNKDFLNGGGFAIGPEHFWSDATIHTQLNNNDEVSTEEGMGSDTVVRNLSDLKQRHKLYFSPNLSAEGVKGRMEPHGMIAVLVCGTLHQSAGVVVGIFEQIFYLIRDPLSENNWKIKRTQLSLTSKLNVCALPTLSNGLLTSQLLPIENPD